MKRVPDRAVLDLLKRLEWSSYEEGQGSEFMSSGPGPWVRACPSCRGIDPSDHYAGDFNVRLHNHRKTCQLRKIIDALE